MIGSLGFCDLDHQAQSNQPTNQRPHNTLKSWFCLNFLDGRQHGGPKAPLLAIIGDVLATKYSRVSRYQAVYVGLVFP